MSNFDTDNPMLSDLTPSPLPPPLPCNTNLAGVVCSVFVVGVIFAMLLLVVVEELVRAYVTAPSSTTAAQEPKPVRPTTQITREGGEEAGGCARTWDAGSPGSGCRHRCCGGRLAEKKRGRESLNVT